MATVPGLRGPLGRDKISDAGRNCMIRGGQAVLAGAAFILPQVSPIQSPGKWIFA